MGKADSEVEDMAVDIYLFDESLKAASNASHHYMDAFKNGYKAIFGRWNDVFQTVTELERRRRYV